MPLAVLVAGDLVSGRRPQPPAPSVTLNPIRTRWMEHLGRRPPCLRIMPFRTSCGRPDPAAGAVCGGHDRVFPALSRPRLSPWSSWPVIPIPHPPQPRILEAESSPVVLGALAAHGPLAIPVAPNNTPTRWMEHQRRQAACLRTTRCRTSYEFPNPAAGAVCGTMTGCFRHCGRHDSHRGAAGQS